MATTTAAAASAAWPAKAATGLLAFDVYRNDSIIGRHSLNFREDGDELAVDIAIDLKVKLAFVTLYSYTHRNTERWRDGRLVSMQSRTDDNGTSHRVSVRPDGDDLIVDGDVAGIRVPGDAVPTTYWQPSSVRKAAWIDSQRGGLIDLNVSRIGTEPLAYEGRSVPSNRYGVRGDLNLDVWYSDLGWTKLEFEVWDGSIIRYKRRSESDVAALEQALTA